MSIQGAITREPNSHDPCRFAMLLLSICEELETVPVDMLVKVLAAVHRAIQRRSIGGNSYLEFVSRFTQIGPK